MYSSLSGSYARVRESSLSITGSPASCEDDRSTKQLVAIQELDNHYRNFQPEDWPAGFDEV
jgi:hypothetical protein